MGKHKPRMHKDRPVYFAVRLMVDPETGEELGCLVPNEWVDRRLMRDRKQRLGSLVRATLTNPRSVPFHRLVHMLGTMVRENIDGFELLDSHAVIKKLQRDSGVCCEVVQIAATPVIESILDAAEKLLGEIPTRMLRAVLPEIEMIDVRVPHSISFDCMDEAEFRQLWEGLCKHIIANYWPSLTVEQITNMTNLMPQNEGL